MTVSATHLEFCKFGVPLFFAQLPNLARVIELDGPGAMIQVHCKWMDHFLLEPTDTTTVDAGLPEFVIPSLVANALLTSTSS